MISSTLNDMSPEKVSKKVDGKTVIVNKRCSPKTFVNELKSFQGILTEEDWGGTRVMELHDPGVAEDIMQVIKKYEAEGPIRMDLDAEFHEKPTAQWVEKTKNCTDLAMSIEQQFSETIFREQMSRRKRWKELLKAHLEVENNGK